jgi:hypoxanthine phosphoribosyltransferase
MKEITLHQKNFVQCIPSEYLESLVDAIALKMNRELTGKEPLFISILNGSFMFTSDLMKRLSFPCYLSFIKLNSYNGIRSEGEIKTRIGLTEEIENRTVVIIEDIVDTGATLSYFLEDLKLLRPKEIKIASMFFKPDACKHEIKIDYLGMEIPNDFVVGYGLDFNGLGRNFRDLYKLKGI